MGNKQTTLRTIYNEMLEACNDPTSKEFKHCGGKMIVVYPQWEDDYYYFRRWAEKAGYKIGMYLVRKDKNQDFEPCNCTWISREEFKRRNNIVLIYDGVEYTVNDIHMKTGVHRNTILSRIKKGDKGEKLFRETERRGHK
jgi:hypothetical protein